LLLAKPRQGLVYHYLSLGRRTFRVIGEACCQLAYFGYPGGVVQYVLGLAGPALDKPVQPAHYGPTPVPLLGF
jgi:hypothetical protein